MKFREFISKAHKLSLSGQGYTEVFIIDSNGDNSLAEHWSVGSDKHGRIYLEIKSGTEKEFMLKDRTLLLLINDLELYSRNFPECSISIKEGAGTEFEWEHDIIDVRVGKIPASNDKDVVIIQYLPKRVYKSIN